MSEKVDRWRLKRNARMNLSLDKALRTEKPMNIAFVGAGGKTSAIFQLARQIGPAIVTTTTHLGPWETDLADQHIQWADGQPLPEIPESEGIILLTGPIDPVKNRCGSLNARQIETLRQFAESHKLPLLIEADGSRKLPLKAPAEHEPAIPEFVEIVVVVSGLSGLGQPLAEENIHRAAQFAALSGLKLGENVTAAGLAKVLNHAQGGLKNIPAGAKRVALLNQADSAEIQAAGGSIAGALLNQYDSVLIASLKDEKIHAVFEPVAGIILAAGQAARFGKPKQLLDFHGEPFVRRVAKTALAAGLSPVVVVTGAYAEEVEAAVKDLDVQIVRNAEWEEGQASSIRAGLGPSPHPASPSAGHPPPNSTEVRRIWGRAGEGAAIFLLADQPQVTRHVLDALKSRHAEGLFPIVAPLVADRRGNPVLFDRVTFDELRALQGDVGGRVLFRKYPLEYVPWHDESLLFDVDDDAAYRRLLAWGVDDF
jgi:molybdenum cofactor cytidylyltransferase